MVATFASNLTSDSNFPCQILYVPLSYLFEDCILAEGKWFKLNLLPRKHPTSVKVKSILISCPSHATCLITRTSGTCAASSEQAPQVRTFEHLGAPWGTLGHIRAPATCELGRRDRPRNSKAPTVRSQRSAWEDLWERRLARYILVWSILEQVIPFFVFFCSKKLILNKVSLKWLAAFEYKSLIWLVAINDFDYDCTTSAMWNRKLNLWPGAVVNLSKFLSLSAWNGTHVVFGGVVGGE